MGVSYAEPFLNHIGWEDILTSLVSCLSDNNHKVTIGALQMIEKLLQTKKNDQIQVFLSLLWGPIKEKMGDNKLPAREQATNVLLLLIEKCSLINMMDKLKLCCNHKNWRIREQLLKIFQYLVQQSTIEKQYYEDIVHIAIYLLEDSTKEVREASLQVLEQLYTTMGATLMSKLKGKQVRPAQLRILTKRLNLEDITLHTNSTTSSNDKSAFNSKIEPPTELPQNNRKKKVINASLPSERSSPAQKMKMSQYPSPYSSPSRLKLPQSATTTLTTTMSDKEIQTELTQVLNGLNDQSDWSKRYNALQKFQQLISSRSNQLASLLYPNTTTMRTIRDLLCKQIGDLRSSIAREGCETISILAKSMPEEYFNYYAEAFIIVLLKSTTITINIISSSAVSTIENVIKSTSNGYPKVILKFVEMARDKNQIIRFHAIDFVALICLEWHANILEKYLTNILDILPSVLRDAQGDVRAASRKCYWALHCSFPEQVQVVLNTLDAANQKRILDDDHKLIQRPAVLSNTAKEVSKASTSTANHATNSTMNSKLSKQSTVINSSQTESSGQTSIVKNSLLSHSTSTITGPPRRVLDHKYNNNTIHPSKQEYNGTSNMLSGPIRIENRHHHGMTSSNNGNSSTSHTASYGDCAKNELLNNNKPQRVLNAVSNLSKAQQFPVHNSHHLNSQQSSQQSNSKSNIESSGYSTGHSNNSILGEAKRIPFSTSKGGLSQSTTTSASYTSSSYSNATSTTGGIVEETAVNSTSSTSHQCPVSSTTSASSMTSNSNSYNVNGAKSSLVAIDITKALTELDHTIWSRRVASMEEVIQYIKLQYTSPTSTSTSSTSNGPSQYELDKILKQVMLKLKDRHYRVVQITIQAMMEILEIASSIVQSKLKVLLPQMFLKLGDSKESIRTFSKTFLTNCQLQFDANLLSHAIVTSCLDSLLPNCKVKVAIYDYLYQLLPLATEYFTNVTHVRYACIKVLQQMEQLETTSTTTIQTSTGHIHPLDTFIGIIKLLSTQYLPQFRSIWPQLSTIHQTICAQYIDVDNIVLKKSLQDSSTATNANATSRRSSTHTICMNNENDFKYHQMINTDHRDPILSTNGTNNNQITNNQNSPDDDTNRVQDDGSQVQSKKTTHSTYEKEDHTNDGLELQVIEKELEQLGIGTYCNDMKSIIKKVHYYLNTSPNPLKCTRYFQSFMQLLLQKIQKHQDMKSIQHLKHFILQFPEFTISYRQEIVFQLFDTCQQQTQLGLHVIEKIFFDIVTLMPCSTMLALIVQYMETNNNNGHSIRMFPLLLRILAFTIESASIEEVTMDDIGQIIPTLVEAINHTSSEIRIQSVLCFVGLYFLCGSNFQHYLTTLKPVQRKIIQYYIEKEETKQNQVSTPSSLSPLSTS